MQTSAGPGIHDLDLRPDPRLSGSRDLDRAPVQRGIGASHASLWRYFTFSRSCVTAGLDQALRIMAHGRIGSSWAVLRHRATAEVCKAGGKHPAILPDPGRVCSFPPAGKDSFMSVVVSRRAALLMTLSGLVSACAPKVPDSGSQPDPAANVPPEILAMYGELEDNGFHIPAVNPRYLIAENTRTEVDLAITESPGAIIVDPWQRYLYLIRGGNRALRYRVAVGDQGRSFEGAAVAQYDRVWPSWRPTDNMIRERPDMYAAYADGLPGGPQNPLGARAIYLFRGGRDTYYRIHGTNEVASIGHATSAGCIRMYNQDAIHLAANYVKGGKVLVLSPEQSAGAFGSFVPATTPYSGASFNQPAAVPEVAAADPAYGYPTGFPESPYTSSLN